MQDAQWMPGAQAGTRLTPEPPASLHQMGTLGAVKPDSDSRCWALRSDPSHLARTGNRERTSPSADPPASPITTVSLAVQHRLDRKVALTHGTIGGSVPNYQYEEARSSRYRLVRRDHRRRNHRRSRCRERTQRSDRCSHCAWSSGDTSPGGRA